MGKKKQMYFTDNIIRSSEIGQYYYCSIAWYLNRCGYEPISKNLEIGANKHKELGEIIDYTQTNTKNSNIIGFIGIIILLIALLFLFFGVIL